MITKRYVTFLVMCVVPYVFLLNVLSRGFYGINAPYVIQGLVLGIQLVGAVGIAIEIWKQQGRVNA